MDILISIPVKRVSRDFHPTGRRKIELKAGVERRKESALEKR